MPEWLMGADCKFAGLYLRRFESCSAQKFNVKILYKSKTSNIYSGSRIRTYDLKVMSLASYQTTLSRNLIHKI